MTAILKRYEGKELNEAIPLSSYKLPDDSFNGKPVAAEVAREVSERIAPYYASEELKDVVEYARVLKRPLLIRGEPGTGKTRLAQAVAYELYKENYRKKYFEWFIKSTTKVNDGLYTFDHLARLRDPEFKEKEKHVYRKFGPLGKAFLFSTPGDPAVLLIDEIDKADIDFPNDLLLELDQKRMIIPETEEEVIAAESPIIIITSNDEKELPNAFLRRCVFHYIEFPKPEQLLKIIKAEASRLREEYKNALFPQLKDKNDKKLTLPPKILTQIRDRFDKLYWKMRNDPNTSKVPSTSELLDWVRIIHYHHLLSKPVQVADIQSADLLYPEVLLKTLDDFRVQTNKT